MDLTHSSLRHIMLDGPTEMPIPLISLSHRKLLLQRFLAQEPEPLQPWGYQYDRTYGIFRQLGRVSLTPQMIIDIYEIPAVEYWMWVCETLRPIGLT